jgi:hypothetical protein
MLLLKDALTFELDYRSVLVAASSGMMMVVVDSRSGRITLCPLEHGAGMTKLSTGCGQESCSPHPYKQLLAVVAVKTRRLRVLNFDGAVVFEEETASGMEHCWFDQSGDYLWCASLLEKGKVEVQLRETGSWRIVGRETVEDPFRGGSSASLYPAGGSKVMALWLGAGRDGQCVYWISRDGERIACALEPRLQDTTPPIFSPNGSEFIVNDESGVNRYSSPGVDSPKIECLGVCDESPFGEEQPFGRDMCYLSEKWALASTFNDRIVVIDVLGMRFETELVVEGHEPRPTEAYYPRLAGDMELCTDIGGFERVGDHVVFLYQYDRSAPEISKREEKMIGLLCFPAGYILEKLSLT